MKLVQTLGTNLEMCFPSCLSQPQIEFCETSFIIQIVYFSLVYRLYLVHTAPAQPHRKCQILVFIFQVLFHCQVLRKKKKKKKKKPNRCFHLPHWSVFANNQPIRAENNDIKVSFLKNGKWIYGLLIFLKNCYILKIALGRLEFIVCKLIQFLHKDL